MVGLRRLPDTQNTKMSPPPPQQIRKNNNPPPVTTVRKTPAVPIVEDDSSSNDSSTMNSNLHNAMQFKPLPPKLAPEDESILQSTDVETGNDEISNYTEINSPFKGMSLKDFESQRRVVEEQNKQKKELLFKTIEQQYGIIASSLLFFIY